MEIAETLDVVRERPGEWAVIKTYEMDKLGTARSWAIQVRKRFDGYQTVAALKDGSAKVFARYVGMSEETPEAAPAEETVPAEETTEEETPDENPTEEEERRFG